MIDKFMKDDFSIFISSSDEYSDLWDMFFSLFQEFWPDYSGKIYLNTQKAAYSYDGLNVIATQVGKGMRFGETFRSGLDKVDTDNVLLMMIDYLIMDVVASDKIEALYKIFCDNELDTLRLKHHPFKSMQLLTNGLYKVCAPQKDMFSFQNAFWRKDVLSEMVLSHENPWAAEWHGTKRANMMNIQMQCVASDQEPIKYLSEGALHKGKWVAPIISFLEQQGIMVDYSKRGLFDPEKEKKLSWKDRLVAKCKRSPSAFRSIMHGLWLRMRSKVKR